MLFLFANLSAQTKKNSSQQKNKRTKNKSNSKTESPNKVTENSKLKEKSSNRIAADSRKKRLKKQTTQRRISQTARAQEARRQAAFAEQRRRAQIAREAQAKRIAFERGLRTETVAKYRNDNVEGEDLEIRRAAVNALGNHAGTIVVLEPQTGKVLPSSIRIGRFATVSNRVRLSNSSPAIAGINENIINADGNINARRISDES